MPNQGRITPKQIELARKILSIIPPKDNTRTREEAGEVLAKDFKLAFKKGYSPREIAAMLKVYGIIIPASVVAKYEGPETDKEIDVSRLLEASGKCSRKKVRAVPPKSLPDNSQVRSSVAKKEAREQMGDRAIDSANQDSISVKEFCNQTDSNPTSNKTLDHAANCGEPEIQIGHCEEKSGGREIIDSMDAEKAESTAIKNVPASANSVSRAQKVATPIEQNGTEKLEGTQLHHDGKNIQAKPNSPEAGKNPWDMDLDDWCGPAKINPANYGTFKIKPDTPKGEL